MLGIDVGDAVIGAALTAFLSLLGLIWKTGRDAKTSDRSSDNEAATERLRLVHDATLELVKLAQDRAKTLGGELEQLGDTLEQTEKELVEALQHVFDLLEAFGSEDVDDAQAATVERATQFLRTTRRRARA